MSAPAAVPGLYDRPVLVIDPEMHTATIRCAAADDAGRWAVTGAEDKTVRLWSMDNGTLLRTIRLPAGPGEVGKVFSVAMTPDGTLIAAAGWTRWTDDDQQEQIYLFDRANGTVVRRIGDLPSGVFHLVFSPDGQLLAATLSSGGLCVYARAHDWGEVARDTAYDAASYGADFARDGRLATTGYDGKVRVYAADLAGEIRPRVIAAAPGGRRPFGVAFSPDGTRLAIGYDDSTAVTLLDGDTLVPQPGPDLTGIEKGNLVAVAWSRDGGTLFAAGGYGSDDSSPVLAWAGAGAGARRRLAAGKQTVTRVVPLADGGLLVTSGDPLVARLNADGSTRWMHRAPKADFNDQYDKLAVSHDGMAIDFGYEQFGKVPARFDVATLALSLAPPADGRTVPPRQDGFPIPDWHDTDAPRVGRTPVQLDELERSVSLAASADGDFVVLGADWSLRALDAGRKTLWKCKILAGPVWAVNITGDGKLVVVAYHDGTIRWHLMADGVELLAFMPLEDRSNWAAWTPQGLYTSTAGTFGVLRWHINRGWDAPADSVAIDDIRGARQPNVLPLVLQERETERAVGRAVLAELGKEVMIRTQSDVCLHLLAIGISVYNEQYASHLRLNYARRDAEDFANTIIETQSSLYRDVKSQVPTDKDAHRKGIMDGLENMRALMKKGGGADLAVVYFSGHAAIVDDRLYLLPYDVNASDESNIQESAVAIEEFRYRLLKLAEHGQVLVLLDACHSGAISMTQRMDATALRTALAAAKVTVITSSSRDEVSREDARWEHGAFTKVLLDAFTDPAADEDRNGVISTVELARYVCRYVSRLTEQAQTPGMEIRFDTTVFAVGQRGGSR